jgi:uncharacterized protein YgbK (DUF1537 family)
LLRLLADDLTGALDSAAPFAAARGPVRVVRQVPPDDAADDLALDSETRDAEAGEAARRAALLAPWLAGASLAFKKIDSRLRGQPVAEIAATVAAGRFRTAVVAPAFPAQGRVTRGARQFVRRADGGWEDAGVDLRGGLEDLGLPVTTAPPRPGGGVFLCDAATEADLAAIAARRPGLAHPVLWCGTAGLARALAGPAGAPRPARLPRPAVVLCGSPHPASRAQLAALPSAGAAISVHRLQLADESPRGAAADALASLVARLAAGEPPGSAIVTGGETLLRLCQALDATALTVLGEAEPGIAAARFVDGRWAGIPFVAKSGGFGDPFLLCRLLALPAAGHG